jgi:hypothetical protein
MQGPTAAPLLGLLEQSLHNLTPLLQQHVADMLGSTIGTLDETPELLLRLGRGEDRGPEVVVAAEVDHRRPVVPGRQHVVCRGTACLQVDVFDEVDGAVDALHRRRLVGLDPLSDGDVADVGAEEEEVR